MNGLISIVLPNLNTPLPFLRERLQTITEQTFTNWECIIADGYSDNGSWEYLKETAEKDKRFQAYQFKKEGIYNAWNNGINLAKGQYIYIAPSDDTMTGDCLQKLYDVLQQYPECELACCLLKIIGDNGQSIPGNNWDNYYPAQYFGELLQTKHIRYAPYDGILHCGIQTVYTSITQLLIKRSLFEKTGLFLTGKGSTADLEWGMRAGLVANVVHVPEYLATWRIHDQQASDDALQWEPASFKKFQDYIDHAFNAMISKGLLDKKYFIPALKNIYLSNEFDRAWMHKKQLHKKLTGLFKYFFKNPALISGNMLKKITGRLQPGNVQLIRALIKKLQLDDHIQKITE
jgi:glycosyltransferase involved in cell wall biosynthesis